MDDMRFDELQAALMEKPIGKRYLVVMDSMWKSGGVWNTIKSAVPNHRNGSRILITCREKVVSMEDSKTPPYSLPFLDDDNSWQLLRKMPRVSRNHWEAARAELQRTAAFHRRAGRSSDARGALSLYLVQVHWQRQFLSHRG